MTHLTGGAWDATARGLYFLTTTGERPDAVRLQGELAAGVTPFLRISLGALEGAAGRAALDALCDRAAVLLDAGAGRLAAAHAKAHDIPVAEVLALPAEALDGWARWRDRWCAVVAAFGARLWGYTEPELGDVEARAATRAALEADGAQPIPVTVPLEDTWDAFDTLVRTYDRVAIAGVAGLAAADRVRVVTAIEMRRRAAPGCWLHYQALAPTPELLGDPRTSCDAARWLDAARFSEVREAAALSPIGTVATQLPATRDDAALAPHRRAGALRAEALGRCWQVMLNGYDRIGAMEPAA